MKDNFGVSVQKIYLLFLLVFSVFLSCRQYNANNITKEEIDVQSTDLSKF